MIVVDTSVWINFFRKKVTAETEFLKIILSDDIDIAHCGVILTEILQGIKNNKEHNDVLRIFKTFHYLEITQDIFIDAASIYQKLQRQGITIRNTIDCLIAATAIYYQTPLLHKDKDFNPIMQYCGLKIPPIFS